MARRTTEDVLSLSAAQELADCRAEAERLWPARPGRAAEYEAWLARAAALVEGLPAHRERRDAIRARGERRNGGAWLFEDSKDRWWHGQLERLIADLEAFADPVRGPVEGRSFECGPGVRWRLEFARDVREASLESKEARELWAQACAAIADVQLSPMYGGLELAPQLGLLPLGPDPESGLWEFADLQTGEPAERDSEGRLVLTDATGLVLVLLPGGSFSMGAQSADPGAANFDALGNNETGPVHTVRVAPFFLSKYELTQAQWFRATGSNPSNYPPPGGYGGVPVTLLHPVEEVSWNDCAKFVGWFGLALPTEAQWEYAARAGTNTPWWTGAERDSLLGKANLADGSAYRAGARWASLQEWPEYEDGWVIHAPVGSFPPNAFGLHDVLGNVFEWCLDLRGSYTAEVRGWNSERIAFSDVRIARGGAFAYSIGWARAGARSYFPPTNRFNDYGLRPARRVDP